MKTKFHVTIGCYYDFDNPTFRASYDEWRDDHPDTLEMRECFVWDRFAPNDIMTMIDRDAYKYIGDAL